MDRQTFTYEPLNVPKPVADGVWIVDGPEIRMSMGPLKVPFPTRMTIVALPDGLWLHSPIALTDELAAAVSELGKVRWLIAPSWLHYAAVDQWRVHFPDAESWGAAGIVERAKAKGIGIILDRQLGRDPAPWADRFETFAIRSRFGEEVEFFHRDSRVLILTDLIENFSPQRVAPIWRLFLRLAGNLGPLGGTPRDYRAAMQDHPAIGRQVREMIALQPKAVILAHGDCYLDNPVPRLRKALDWALKAAA